MQQKIKNIYHLGQAIVANCLYGFPSRGLVVIGVTGTDGKTTTSSLIYHMLEVAGKKAALITSVGATINGKISDTGFHVTTPDVFSLQKYLQLVKESGSKYVVLEVTSHGLDQNRVGGIKFQVGVLTNISHEHLDYHRTLERYIAAKAKLLQIAGTAIINKDDEGSYKKMRALLGNEKMIKTYSLKSNTDVNLKTVPFTTTLPGEFNLSNILAAITTARELGIADDLIVKAIKSYALPEGREEVVYEKEFTVMIDFAHTPHAIEEILKAIKTQIHPKGRIIHVFGSASKRDVTKRPIMGENSSRYADIIILTAEDPRNENPMDIIDQITAGFPKKNTAEILKIPDRNEAIKKAVALAKKGDFIIITGKGHEKSMNLGNGETPWSDHKAVAHALKGKKI